MDKSKTADIPEAITESPAQTTPNQMTVRKYSVFENCYPSKTSRLQFLQRKPRTQEQNFIVSIKDGKLIKK